MTIKSTNVSPIEEIENLGFARTWAVYALQVCNNDTEAAVTFIFEHGEDMESLVEASTDNAHEEDNNQHTYHELGELTPLTLPATTSTQESDGWKCDVCTFMNIDKEQTICAMCGVETAPMELPPSPPEAPSPITGWKCAACTFTNPESQELVCLVCDATKGASFSAVQSRGAAAEPEDEIFARENNISVEEAREILKEREIEDRRFAESISEPKIECIACMEEVPVSEAFTVDCESAHRFCFICMRRQVKISLDEKKIATCLMCSHELSQVEIKQLFGSESAELSTHLATEIGSVMAASPDLYIGCPTPDCKEFIMATTPGVPERITCPVCEFSFCSSCKKLFHGIPTNMGGAEAEELNGSGGNGGGLLCGDAAETFKRWNEWRTQERANFLQKVKVEGLEQQKKMDAATQEALTRFAELQQDEAWKEANCKICPHCGKTVYKVDGCSSMTCGRDARDKGGGNKQDGCGNTFDWRKAAAYVRDSADQARLPKSIKDVDPDAAGEVLHHLFIPEDSEVHSDLLTIKCDVCLKDIVGPRFSCINCFPGLECCIACSDTHKSTTHDPNLHAFQIFFEDVEHRSPSSSSSSSSSAEEMARDRSASWYEGITAVEQARRLASGAGATNDPASSGCSQS